MNVMMVWRASSMPGPWLALAIALGVVALTARADESAELASSAKRPKICLVLSGGGARGAAHLGVIKVLEEYRVPIDCIAGTSMGSLYGAAYATGMTVAEMNQITAGITTELLFRETPPRPELSMRRKQDDDGILFGPEIGIRATGLKFPKGAVTGVQLETVLRQLSKVKGYHNFDQLPIPYRAVATNLVTGTAVVFKEGELANVMRASMSVPGAVAPAEIGGLMLVDGMLTDNLPVKVARAMGADVVIAVNVGTPLLKREQLDGIFGVASQMISILTEQNVQASLASLKPTDILISPELGEFTTGDFDQLSKIAPLGEGAARKVADQLAKLSLPPDQYAALRQRQTVAMAPDLKPINEIRFENLQRVNPETALALMETAVDQPIDEGRLNQDMRRLYGTKDFEHVNYRLIDGPGTRVLAVDAVEKSWGPDYLRFGLGLSSDFSGAANFDLAARYRKTWINSLGAEWLTSLQVGYNNQLTTEFYQPLSAEGTFFVAPNAALSSLPVYLYQGNLNVATYNFSSALVGLDVGSQISRYGELRLGLVRGSLEPKLVTGPPSLSPGGERIAQGGVSLRLKLDQLDSSYFPRSGWSTEASAYKSDSQLGADQNFTRWQAKGLAAYSLGEHTVSLGLNFGGKLGSDPLPAYAQFQWGGFLTQSGYKTGQLIGESLQFGRLMYYQRILRGSLLDGAYGGMSLELGKVANPLVAGNPDGLLKSGSLFVGYDTPLGPVYFGYGYAQEGNSSFYFYLGKPF